VGLQTRDVSVSCTERPQISVPHTKKFAHLIRESGPELEILVSILGAYIQSYAYVVFGDLDKNNPNLKGFQIINHRPNYFKKITSFCFASHGGEAEACASPGGVARRRCASPLKVAKQISVRRHAWWRSTMACVATLSGEAL
jgi:hypothetical protein